MCDRTLVLAALVLAGCGSNASGPSPDSTCNRYLACVARSAPSTYASALQAYGADSACWRTQAGAMQCEQACAGALSNLGAATCGCSSDSDCAMESLDGVPAPRCAPTHDRCVECLQSSDCSKAYGRAVCNAARGVCVGCASNADCAAPTPVCWTYGQSSACVECDDTHACPAGGSCNTSNGSCTSPCDVLADCVMSKSGSTVAACLQADSCCAGEASCSAFQPLRTCLEQNCSTLAPATYDLAVCLREHCQAQSDACHLAGC